MTISTVINTLKSTIAAYTWTSTDGKGTTSFKGVYTYPNWLQDDGYPFVVILDNSGEGVSLDNRNIQFDTNIDISVCVNYGIIDKQTEEEKVEEAMLRLREAWDNLKINLFDFTLMTTLGIDWTLNPNYVDDYDDELNLYKRTITLVIREHISRG
jgi:hypothetical protein